MAIDRVSFEPIADGGDDVTSALLKLDGNCQELFESINGTGGAPSLDQRITTAEDDISALQNEVRQVDLFGLYSARPAATSVQAKTIYYASDVLEAYMSNGNVWTVLPTSGGELGYAEKTSGASTASTTAVDIAGLTVTCKVGEKPILVEYGGNIRHQTAGGVFVIQLVYGTSPTIGSRIIGSSGYVCLQRRTRLSGLTPGSIYTFKLTMNVATAGTMDIYGDASDRPYIRVANT